MAEGFLIESLGISSATYEKIQDLAFVFHKEAKRAVQSLKEDPHFFTDEEVDRYLAFLFSEVEKAGKQKNPPIPLGPDLGGLFSNMLTSGSRLGAFSRKIIKEKETKAKIENEKKRKRLEAIENKFKQIHSDKNSAAFREHLLSKYDELSELLAEITKSDIAISKILQREAKTIEMMISEQDWIASFRGCLLRHQEKLGFEPIPFDLEAYMNDEQYKDVRDAILAAA